MIRLVKPRPHPARQATAHGSPTESSGSMEPAQRGEAELRLVWGTTTAGNDDDAGDAACLCPAAVQAAAASPAAGRHALEQEVLHRADLQQLQSGGGGDPRRERKMRNRESAARSRARRCAYVSELEKEVSILRAEIDDLKKLCKQLKEAAEAPAPAKSNKKRPRGQLQRTSSASF